jgi:hypothetical protein
VDARRESIVIQASIQALIEIGEAVYAIIDITLIHCRPILNRTFG